MKNRGNKAKRDKDSILADTKNLLKILHPIIQPMPKIERIEGAPVEMKSACYNIIRYFNQAKECQEVRQENIRRMFGEFGVLLAAFELCISYGLIKEHDRLAIAIQLERIEEGSGNGATQRGRLRVRISRRSRARKRCLQKLLAVTKGKRECYYHL